MNELSFWTDLNWYALAGLLAELAFLIAGVWFARNLLRTIRAFQEQMGALLKLSITATPSERSTSSLSPKHPTVETSQYWLAPSEIQPEAHPTSQPEPAESAPGSLALAWRGVVRWLRTPMRTRQRASTWRRLVHWLQAPAGS